MPQYAIATITGRPDLAEASARLRWEAFFRAKGMPYEEVLERTLNTAALAAPVMPRTFVLLADGAAVGTASLIASDLDERPALTPWLAGVVVDPATRNQGHGERLVRAVEEAAMAAGIGTLWLYTGTAARLYARLGWHRVEEFTKDSRLYLLMRRDLPACPAESLSVPGGIA